MSTILRRRRTSHGRGALKPSVEHFLNTGGIQLQQPGDNPWMQVSLMGAEARAARLAWLDGDEDGALAALAACPGRPGWFLQ